MILFLGGHDRKLFYISESLRRNFGQETFLISPAAPDRRGMAGRGRYMRLPTESPGWWRRLMMTARLWSIIRKADAIVTSPDFAMGHTGFSRLFREWGLLGKGLKWRMGKCRKRCEASPGKFVDMQAWPFLAPPSLTTSQSVGVLIVSDNLEKATQLVSKLKGLATRERLPLFFRSARHEERSNIRQSMAHCAIICDIDASGFPSETAVHCMASGRCVVTSAPASYYESLEEERYLIADADESGPIAERTPVYGPVVDLPEEPEDLFMTLETIVCSGMLPRMMYDSYLLARTYHDAHQEAARIINLLELVSESQSSRITSGGVT